MEKPNTPSHLHPRGSADVPPWRVSSEASSLFIHSLSPGSLSPAPQSHSAEHKNPSEPSRWTDGSVLAQWQK